MSFSRANGMTVLLALGICALAAWYEPSLPDPVPSHWNSLGEVDGWTAKPWGVWIVPLISSVITVLLLALPFILPARFSQGSTRRRYDLVVLAILVFMLAFATAGWESIKEVGPLADAVAPPPVTGRE